MPGSCHQRTNERNGRSPKTCKTCKQIYREIIDMLYRLTTTADHPTFHLAHLQKPAYFLHSILPHRLAQKQHLRLTYIGRLFGLTHKQPRPEAPQFPPRHTYLSILPLPQRAILAWNDSAEYGALEDSGRGLGAHFGRTAVVGDGMERGGSTAVVGKDGLTEYTITAVPTRQGMHLEGINKILRSNVRRAIQEHPGDDNKR